jgi:hypothetical protein
VNWKVFTGVTAGLFGAGIAVGFAAQKRGIPQDKVGRWLLKETTRRVLRVTDAVRDALPDEPPKRLAEALAEEPPRPAPR